MNIALSVNGTEVEIDVSARMSSAMPFDKNYG